MRLKIAGGVLVIVLAFAGVAYANSGGSSPRSAREALAVKQEAKIKQIEAQATASFARRGPRGPRGPAGPKGSTGLTGPAGTFGAITQILGPTVRLCAYSGGSCAVATGSAVCPAGTVVIGGGEIGIGTPFISSAVNSTTWSVGEYNEFEMSAEFRAVAECASP